MNRARVIVCLVLVGGAGCARGPLAGRRAEPPESPATERPAVAAADTQPPPVLEQPAPPAEEPAEDKEVDLWPRVAGADDSVILSWMEQPSWLNTNVKHRFLYRSRGHLPRPVAGQDAKLGFVQHDLAYHRQRCDMLGALPALRVRAIDVCAPPRLPDTGEPFPQHLWDVQASAAIISMVPPGALNITFGSASDVPFASADEMTLDVTWMSMIPCRRSWVLVPLVNWHNNRDYLNAVPLPGLAALWNPGEKLAAGMGFPASFISARPVDGLWLAASWAFPQTVYTRARYELLEGLHVYGGFEWANQRYFRHDREEPEQRLWYDEKRLLGGVRWEIGARAFLDLSGGWAFDRMFFEGERYEDRDHNRLDVDDGPFLWLRFGLHF